jgi:hypothetical protein
MSSKYQYKDVSLFTDAAPKSVDQNVNRLPITEEFSLTVGGSCVALRMEVVIPAASLTTSIILMLQSRLANGTWVDVSGFNASVAAAGCSELFMSAASSQGLAYMPLAKVCRLTVTTAEDDTVSIGRVLLLQPE